MSMFKLLTSSIAQSARGSFRNICATPLASQQSKNIVDGSDDGKKRRAVSFNQIQLIGGVTDRPRLRATVNGVEYAVFDVITNYHRKLRDGTVYQESLRHNVQAFGNLCKITMDRIDKGTRVFVLGRLRPISFRLEDGRTFPTSAVVAEVIQKISSPFRDEHHEGLDQHEGLHESDELEISDDQELSKKSI